MNLRIITRQLLLGMLSLTLLMTACQSDKDTTVDPTTVKDYSAEAQLKWNQLYLQVERYAGGYRPGPAPRSLAYMGLAAYEACISGMPEYNSVKGLYQGLTIPEASKSKTYHWPTVVNASYAYLMKQFFPNAASDIQFKITSLESELNTKFSGDIDQTEFDLSKAYGESVAAAVWEWSKTDTWGHDAYKDPFGTYDWQAAYNNTPGKWTATFPGPGKPMFPYWGKVRTFAILPQDKIALNPDTYAPYSETTTSAYYAQALEVYSRTIAPTFNDFWIAWFWSDDLLNLTFSPGPRWIAITNEVIAAENSNLETSLYAYVKVGMALNDAAVACWNSKYLYNVERPTTYITNIIDPNWKTLLNNPITGDENVTPSFPAYPSGHSTMGAAAAEVLDEVFGFDYALTDRCHEDRSDFPGSTPRSFNSFDAMALENAESRIALGVHYRMDCTEGVRLGHACGRRVNDIEFKK
ncbi:MAG: vanadium-dependent haloperoxidase [Sphingobacterium thalpophilum]